MFLQISNEAFLEKSSGWLLKVQELAIIYGAKIIGAILLYIIGNWIIKKLVKLVGSAINNGKFDPSLSKFLLSFLQTILLILLLLTIASVLGVDIMGFSAILGGAVIGIGAALNGSLGNLAGGVMMMIFKPFQVGDVIEAQGTMGEVLELGIFNTIVLTPDHKTVILPNGPLSTGVIVNYNSEGGYMRIDIRMYLADSQDVDKARAVAEEVMRNFPGVKQDPAPMMAVDSVSDFMTKIILTPYAHQDDYWEVYFGVTEAVKKAFIENNIEGPIPGLAVYQK